MHEFDRFLDCHDMFRKVLIDIVDQRSLCRRFAGAGRASDKDKTAAEVGKFFYNQRNSQVLQRGNLSGNQPKGRAVTV